MAIPPSIDVIASAVADVAPVDLATTIATFQVAARPHPQVSLPFSTAGTSTPTRPAVGTALAPSQALPTPRSPLAPSQALPAPWSS
jgi:hypothetical protein